VGGKLTTPKNHHCRRIDLSRQLRATLRLWRRQKSAESLKLGVPRPPWVFASAVGTPFDESNIRKVWGRILEKADLRYRRIHDARHTFASLLIHQGESLVSVKEQMGHASIQITVDVYGHLVPGGTVPLSIASTICPANRNPLRTRCTRPAVPPTGSPPDRRNR
jgi:integrase